LLKLLAINTGETIEAETFEYFAPVVQKIRRAAICLSSNRRRRGESHAYMECRHVAQSFALPKFPATQHHVLDSAAGRFCAWPQLSGEEASRRLFDDNGQETPCKKSFPKA
jgi:hypothetical protein